MTTKSNILRHIFGGGWATDFGPLAEVDASTGQISIPFLLNAENIEYELDGGPRKIGGTEKVNSTQITDGGSGSVIRGCYDYWRQASGGNPSRRRVLHADSRVLADNDDGIFSAIITGIDGDSIPSYATFDDLLIIGSSSSADVPKSWDQVTAQDLGGSPPNFSFSVSHQNRHWAAGVRSDPSTLYYSASVDPEDWIGSGSGTIQIDPNDGDMITGIASHKNELWVFKGPYKGSIHRITGASPSQFSRTTFVTGIGAAWHNGIFKFGDDIGFISNLGTIHSLAATSAYGDFFETALSRPIHDWIREHVNFNRLKNIWAVNDPYRGIIIFTISIDSASTNNAILMLDYRFKPIRWAYWNAYDAESANLFQDTNGVKRILLGSTDGYLRRSDIRARSIDGTGAISYKVTTPFMHYGSPMMAKTINQASVGIQPKGSYNGTFAWTRDSNTQQSQTFSQSGGDVLGPAATNQFTLGTSKLAGGDFVDRYLELEEGGEFRSIQYELTQNTAGEDLEVHSFTTVVSGGAMTTENP